MNSPPAVNALTFVDSRDLTEASHQILDKLRGTYNYSCPVHDWPFDVWYHDEHCFTFTQDSLITPAYGTTVIESRWPTFDRDSSPSSPYSEVSIVNTIQLRRSDGESCEITETFVLRLDDHDRRFTLWRPKGQAQSCISTVPLALLGPDDFECLGELLLCSSSIDGSGMHQRQRLCLEMRRSRDDIDRAYDCSQPWTLFKICLYIGPGIEHNIAGKQAGFEMRRSSAHWLLTEKEDLYDWNDGRVELFVPGNEATRTKWTGLSEAKSPTQSSGFESPAVPMMRKDSMVNLNDTREEVPLNGYTSDIYEGLGTMTEGAMEPLCR